MGGGASRSVGGQRVEEALTTSWDARILRAQDLAQNSSASDLLDFYAGLLKLQSGFFTDLSANKREEAAIVAFVPALLQFIVESGPAEFSILARNVKASDLMDWNTLRTSEDELHIFVRRALIQPYREASGCERHEPLISILRSAGEGRKRSLVCGLCQFEGDTARVECPACGEARFDQLPNFTVNLFPYLRIEACDSCKSYVLSIDLTQCPEAVPPVDDIAALPVHMWAQESGYQRKFPGLFGF